MLWLVPLVPLPLFNPVLRRVYHRLFVINDDIYSIKKKRLLILVIFAFRPVVFPLVSPFYGSGSAAWQ